MEQGTKPPLVYFLVLGGGYMGSTAIHAIRVLAERRSDLEFKVLGVIEPRQARRVEIRQACTAASIQAEIFDGIQEALGYQRYLYNEHKLTHPIIVYDASPPQYHFNYLYTVYNRSRERPEQYHYLGEKPLFIEPADIRSVQLTFDPEFYFYCDFIEMANPVFTTVKEYIERNGLDLCDIKLWRAGSSGLKHVVGDEREGIQGGALLDKAGHDLSITIGLLGIDELRQPRFQLDEVRPVCFLPYDTGCLEDRPPLFKTIDGKATMRIFHDPDDRLDLVADAGLAMSVRWFTRQGSIPSEYLFSWIGRTGDVLETKFVEELRSLNLTEDNWLDYQGEVISNSGRFVYEVEDIRIGIFSCRDREGKTVKIVCNFVGKAKLQRYARAFIEGEEQPQVIFDDEPQLYKQAKGQDLSAIFERVVDSSLSAPQRESRLIGRDTSLMVHTVMLRAQDRLFSAERDSLGEFERSVQFFRQRIRPS